MAKYHFPAFKIQGLIPRHKHQRSDTTVMGSKSKPPSPSTELRAELRDPRCHGLGVFREKNQGFVRKCHLRETKAVWRNVLVLRHFPQASRQSAPSPELPGSGVRPSPPKASLTWRCTEAPRTPFNVQPETPECSQSGPVRPLNN